MKQQKIQKYNFVLLQRPIDKYLWSKKVYINSLYINYQIQNRESINQQDNGIWVENQSSCIHSQFSTEKLRFLTGTFYKYQGITFVQQMTK